MISVRKATDSDAGAIAAAETRYIDCAWTIEQIAREINNPDALFFVAQAGEEFVGYLSGVCAADECEISNIAVETAYRRQKAATDLFSALFKAAAERGVRTVFLLVRSDNFGAIGLYKSIGFVAVGNRPGYYKSADAVIMRRNL